MHSRAREPAHSFCRFDDYPPVTQIAELLNNTPMESCPAMLFERVRVRAFAPGCQGVFSSLSTGKVLTSLHA